MGPLFFALKKGIKLCSNSLIYLPKFANPGFSGRYDTFCNTQKRNITILSK